MRQVMLTTTDNPYDPFTQFDEWFAYDEVMGYHTCAYLARVAPTSHDLPPEEESNAIERGIDEIVRLNLNGKYKKVEKESDF